MLRIAVLLLIVCVLFRWAFGEWPWAMLKGKPSRNDAIREARQLLGVGKTASKEDILAAHRRLVATVHPDKGGSNADMHRANDARDLLLETVQRGDGSLDQT